MNEYETRQKGGGEFNKIRDRGEKLIDLSLSCQLSWMTYFKKGQH